MSYSQNYKSAARRTLKSAQILFDDTSSDNQHDSKAVAGYLFGLAGELAVKDIMLKSGMQELHRSKRRECPFYSHFPNLKSRLIENIKSRRMAELLKIAKSSQLFQFWDTDMRYAPAREIKISWVNAWKTSAEQLFKEMNDL
jgi:hypothetical protein